MAHGWRSALALEVSAAVAVMLVACVAHAPTADAVPNPVPVLTLQLTPTMQQVHVTDTVNDAVMFAGNATVEAAFGFMTVTVTLSASCIWPAIVSPSTMEFKDTLPQPFYVTVVVPPKTSALEIGQLIVSGTAKAPGMPTATATANAVVTVAQYFMFDLSARNDTLTGAAPGATLTGRLTIHNTGNGLDSFRIALIDPAGAVAHCSGRTHIDIQHGESASIDFTLTVASTAAYAKGATVGISFNVTSTEAENMAIALSHELPFLIVFGPPASAGPDGPSGNETGVPGGEGTDGGGEALTAVTIVAALVLAVAVVVLATRRRGRSPVDADEAPVEVEPTAAQA